MKIPALTQLTIQERLTTIPLLNNTIMHNQKKFYEAQKAFLILPGGIRRHVVEAGTLKYLNILKESVFLFQLPPYLLGRRKQWPPLERRQFKHPWYLVNSSLHLWEKWLFAVFPNPGKSDPRYSKLGNIAFAREHWVQVVLALYYLVICLALQPQFP